jgi:primosomal protein N' (replication factor Y)
MASDTMGGPKATAELFRRVADRQVDLVIGTQIVAKGHHFPFLTLVGVIDADLGLGGGDLRAGERTYQLLTHVAGRAGRAERPGRAFLQTFMPEHPLMQALVKGDSAGFLAAESASRRAAGMPPFGRLAALIVSGPDEAAVIAAARALGHKAPHDQGVNVLGPAPAPLALLRGRHRHRLLLKCAREVDVQAVLRTWLKSVPLPAGVRLAVDVDPYSFL